MAETEILSKKFESYVRKEGLVSAGDKIVLAISGGADSTAMLSLFAKLKGQINISLLGVHINHQLRGDESQRDEDLCRELCLRLNIPIIIRKIEVSATSDLENQARIKRYEILNQILKLYSFDKIATAHHKQDQAETVLMNLIRGAGINGMAGIKPRSGNRIHPLLCFEKKELLELLNAQQISWGEDYTNKDNDRSRNRIRNQVIPLLEDSFNPNLVEGICRQAEIFRKSNLFIQSCCTKHLKKLILDQTSDAITLSIKLLQKLSEIEQYYVLKQVYAIISKQDNDFFSYSFDEIMSLCKTDGSKQSQLQHGIVVLKQYEELIFCKSDEASKLQAAAITVDIERSWVLHMDYRFHFRQFKQMPTDPELWGENHHVVIDLDKVSLPLTIRPRKSGDRFVPLGMKHSKKLKEFFIDEKVPKFERDKVPLLEDQQKILWVVGLRMDERVRCDQGSSRYLLITAEEVLSGRKRAANRKN